MSGEEEEERGDKEGKERQGEKEGTQRGRGRGWEGRGNRGGEWSSRGMPVGRGRGRRRGVVGILRRGARGCGVWDVLGIVSGRAEEDGVIGGIHCQGKMAGLRNGGVGSSEAGREGAESGCRDWV